MPNEAVLYRTHFFNPIIRREVERLAAEVPACAHWVVGYVKEGAAGPDTPEKIIGCTGATI